MSPTPSLTEDVRVDAAPRPASAAWVRWAVLLGAWGLIAAIDATQTRFYFSLHEPEYGWGEAAVRSASTWGLWVLFTPLIFALSRRLPLDRVPLRRAAGVHAAAALGFALLHITLAVGLAFAIGWAWQYGHTPAVLFQKYLTGKVHLHLLTYVMIAGLFYAREYHQRYRERELAASQLQARLAEAQLQALKTQIQPHFLFNTLNSISVLALRGDTQCAVRMLSRLSDLLRFTLESSGTQEISLREELDVLQRYLDIERVRFPDRLTVEVEADPSVLEAAVPTLILQPLVENAVRHGIAQTLGAGRLEVRASREGARLRLEVRDTGPGLPPGGRAAVKEGIGLSNVHARLAKLYGTDASFELADAPGGGALAVVEMPLRLRAPVPRSAEAAAYGRDRAPEPAPVP
ncbi:MAG TPA: histidine kinase [Longimicrobium sp.]|nr:histidine kinase [Longimicrobium sp.]